MVNKNDQKGSDAEHYIQYLGARLMVSIRGNITLGADAVRFVRDSSYSLAVLEECPSAELRRASAWR